MKNKTYGVLIGRFQPLHYGHVSLIRDALTVYDELIILIGSCNSPATLQNPFSAARRKSMISETFAEEESKGKIKIDYLRDYHYDDALWVQRVKDIVNYHIDPIHRTEVNISIVGNYKDQSSYYLKMFPEWGFYQSERYLLSDGDQIIHSTKIREQMFKNRIENINTVPEVVNASIKKFYNEKRYTELEEEYKFIQNYKSEWSNTPYPPVFVTVDTIVEHDNKILLIKRGQSPGKNKWALPGGFIDINETLEKAALRELEEETGLISNNTIKNLKPTTMFVCDYPNRSQRGRTITNVFYYVLDNKFISHPKNCLPTVCAKDDAKEVFWMDLNNLPDPTQFHDDHYQIIERLYCKELAKNR